MKSIIIDDEINAIKSLRWDIDNFIEDLEIIDGFTSPLKAIEFIENYKDRIDIIFLDINMPEMDGFQFLNKVNKLDIDFEVIFTTAHLNFALDAIKAEAIDYLLKPIDSDELKVAIDKVRKRIAKGDLQQRFSEIYNVFERNKTQLNTKIRLMSNKELLFIDTDDIIYFKSDGNYCSLYLEGDKEIVICKNHKEIESELDDKLFFRVHKSYTINLDKITSYIIADGLVILNNTIEIPVSRTRKNDFLDTIT